jgi:diaminopimelate decarboxylase
MLAQCAAELRQRFGWQPSVVDIGGGYAHRRDPESGQEVGTHDVATADDYAQATTGALRSEFGRLGLKLPSLWLEPGRYLVSNSTLLLSRVGQVNRDPGGSFSWVHIDASTNHCLRVPLQNYHYRITSARQQHHGSTMLANVTGPTCTMDLIAERRTIPSVEAGDLVAIWDVGGYAEVMATQFNLIPRPAAILVCGDQAEPIRRREEFADLMRTQIVPERLRRVAGAGNFPSSQMQQGGTQS